MSNIGYIQLHRKLTQWEWYSNVPVRITFIHLLLIANWREQNWQGNLVKRGQVIIGRTKLSKEIGISEQVLRSSLKKLQTTHEIDIQTTNKFTLVTIVKYEDYQGNENDLTNHQPSTNQQLTNNQPTNNQQITTTKEYNNINNINKQISKETNYTEIAEIFNEICHRLPKINKISETRKSLINARIKEYDLKTIGEVFNKVSESDFLNGANENGWTASFDWIFNSANFLKILEDNYRNKVGNSDKDQHKQKMEYLNQIIENNKGNGY